MIQISIREFLAAQYMIPSNNIRYEFVPLYKKRNSFIDTENGSSSGR